MNEMKPYAQVTLNWLNVEPPLKFPQTNAFATTGYRMAEGIQDLFSVYVVLRDGVPSPGRRQEARIFALVPAMDERLPNPGEHFIITAGATAVAQAIVLERGQGHPYEPQ